MLSLRRRSSYVFLTVLLLCISTAMLVNAQEETEEEAASRRISEIVDREWAERMLKEEEGEAIRRENTAALVAEEEFHGKDFDRIAQEFIEGKERYRKEGDAIFGSTEGGTDFDSATKEGRDLLCIKAMDLYRKTEVMIEGPLYYCSIAGMVDEVEELFATGDIDAISSTDMKDVVEATFIVAKQYHLLPLFVDAGVDVHALLYGFGQQEDTDGGDKDL